MSPSFSLPRFQRVLLNDLLRSARPAAYYSLVALAGTVLLYLANFGEGKPPGEPPLNQVLFSLLLLATGLISTSSIFQDMHHPLERYHYLMLPISNLERFLSRYLLTGPLRVIYVVVAFSIMDWIGNLVTGYFINAREPLFSPFTAEAWLMIRIYLFLHVIVFTGAICFRSHHLIKTALSLIVVGVGMLVSAYLAMRVFYFDAFSGLRFEPVSGNLRLRLMPLFEAGWINTAIVLGFAAWLLYVAYRCLRSHEVQNEL